MTSCWIITEGIAGTENQCLGVAEALGVIPVIKRINLRQPWKTLSPYLACEQSWSFTGDPLCPPWPDLVIASGRKAIAASRYIKKQSIGQTFTVQIQDPRITMAGCDLIAVPAHDNRTGENVLVTDATPNRITSEKLEEARHDFEDMFKTLPSPRVAVLIGGKSKVYDLTESNMATITKAMDNLDAQGYGLMVTASRRTGESNLHKLKDTLSRTKAFLWDGEGTNPYFGMLAWADYIMVTADSASMISEAATTGKPVYVINLEGGSDKFTRFHQNLLDKGIVRRFEGTLMPYSYPPLRDAALVAEAIRSKMGKMGKGHLK
ncbi:MAG: mitochondrial fission ELM1 family protein [Micavibrio sp.]